MMNLNTLLPSRDDLMEEGTQQHASADNGGPVQCRRVRGGCRFEGVPAPEIDLILD